MSARQDSATDIKAPEVCFKTSSIHNAGTSLMVDGRLEDRNCHLTVDTGSEISIVRRDFVQNMSEINLQPQVGWLRTVTGERTPIHGWNKMGLVIGRLKMSHNMVVT